MNFIRSFTIPTTYRQLGEAAALAGVSALAGALINGKDWRVSVGLGIAALVGYIKNNGG